MAIDPKEIKSIEDSMVHDVADDKDEVGHQSKSRVIMWWVLGIVVVAILGLIMVGVFRSAIE